MKKRRIIDFSFHQGLQRSGFEAFCKEAAATRRPIRIRRRNGRELVLIAAEQFDSLMETVHLLSSPHNAARLLAALARARRNKVKPLSVKELRAALRI